MTSITVSKTKLIQAVTVKHALIVGTFAALWCALSLAKAEIQREWSQILQFEPANSADRGHGFELYHMSQNQSEFIGTCVYDNNGRAERKPARVVIEGVETAGGGFWPYATLEVKNERTGEWQKIADNSKKGRRTSITIEPSSHYTELTVKLDPFKPFIGKNKLGRIVLKRGEAAQFELKYLLPPEQEDKPQADKRDK